MSVKWWLRRFWSPISEAATKGKQAYENGLPIIGNPYDKDTKERKAWASAWRWAKRADKLDKKYQRRLGNYGAWPYSRG